jgi:hypothetical protein
MRRPTSHSIARLAAAAACLLLAAPAARADLASGSEGQQNRFSFHPSIQITSVGDNNVRLKSKNRDGDVGMFMVPRVELGYQGAWFDLGADLGADIRAYTDSSSPSDEFFRLNGFAEFGLLPGLSTIISNSYVPTPVYLGRPEDHSANLVQTNRVVASVNVWRELPFSGEMLLSFQGAHHISEAFAAEIGPGVFADDFHANFWEGSMLWELQAPLFGRTTGFVRSHARYRTFDDSTASNFGDFSLLIGARTDWFRSFDFDFALGYGMLGFDTGKKNRFLGQANLRYRMAGGTTLRFSFVNRNTADIIGNDFVETTGKLAIERRFGERTAASVEIFLSRFNNEAWDTGANIFGGVEAKIRRQLTRRMQLELIYRYWDNRGDYSIDDFRQDQVSLRFTYRR